MGEFCVKVLSDIENITEKLNKNKFILKNYMYDIKVYMVKKDCDVLKINSANDLKEYAIIEDYNRDKNVILYAKKQLTSKISNLGVMVELLDELNYKELLYINKDIYIFEKGELTFEILDVRDHGVFLSISDEENKDKILDKFEQINIKIDMSNTNINLFDIALEKAKEK